MKKSLITASLLFCITTNFLNADNLDKKEEIIIKELITQTLNGQDFLKNNKKIINKKELFKKLPKHIIYAGKKYNKEEYIKEISRSYQNIKNNGIKIINSSSKIEKIECMSLENDSVDCYVKEIIQTTSVPENNLSYIVKGQENIEMKFNLKRDSNYKWFIEEEKIFGFEPTFSNPSKNDDEFEKDIDTEVDNEVKKININRLNKDKNKINLNVEKSSGYNGSKAASYARKYALKYNPNYRAFSHDCTNFASQSVKAGGWIYDNGYYKDNHNWWYNWVNQTYSWAAAHNFWWFNEYHNRSYIVSSICSLELGDIISADWNKDLHVDHSMIVTGKSGCSIWVSYHSTDTLDRSFASLPSDAYYWGWHITGTNN